MRYTLEKLRADAIRRTLFPRTSLKRALERLGFVQADPIRSPARAQDLILRHRVADYRAGDLERRYARLNIEEDFLYAYGFVPRSTWQLLHPRQFAGLTTLEEKVLSAARRLGQVHPRDLAAELGRERAVNAWGGYSKSTTQALHRLHYRGLLRIAGREGGIRVYEPTAPLEQRLHPAERLKQIALLLAGIFAPAPLLSLREVMRFLARAAPGLTGRLQIVAELVKSGDLDAADVEGLTYVWPAGTFRARTPLPAVKFLAPFDPLVWDRRRFEHLWGWRYRFEAYTPPSKRKMGYYAMPLLWGDAVIGWANISVTGTRVSVKTGYVDGRGPRSDDFQRALRAETEAFKQFLLTRETLSPEP